MNATTAASLAGSRRNSWRAVVAASIGNALEWFDLVVYGFFAVIIAKLFFPAGNDTVSLLLTLGTFGVSFFMRPLGAIVIGAYADRAGRKAALTLSILLMMMRHADHRGLADVSEHRRCRARDSRVRASDARLFGGRRVRQRDGFSRGTRTGAARFLRELAGREPGAHHAARRRLRRTADRQAVAGADGLVGLARAVLLRSPDRAGRVVHPHQTRRNA